MARASRHPPAIRRGDGPPGATGAPVTGEPGTVANWTIRSCPVSATQTGPVAAIARPCGNSRSSAARLGSGCRPNSVSNCPAGLNTDTSP